MVKIKERLCEEAPGRIADLEPLGQWKMSLDLNTWSLCFWETHALHLSPASLAVVLREVRSGEVCVPIEELIALMMIKIYNFI